MQENDPRLVIGATAPRRSLAEVTTPHPWTTAAREHLGPSNTMRNACAAVVSELAASWTGHRAASAGDPWLDEGFADRFTLRLRWLTLSVLRTDELRLSDAETALLVTFPYLHQAFWAKQAETVLRGTDPAVAAFASSAELPKFSAFAAGFGALHRRGVRALSSGDPAATGIGWWLFHQWLVRQPECYGQENITSLLPASIPPPLNAVLTAPRLTELMRAVQLDPAYLRRVDRPARLRPTVRLLGGTELEQDLREQLLGYLLVVAHRTAVDPTVLPRVIADHLGIDDGITPGEVLTSIREATWDGNRTRVLTATCQHPATALALHDRAAAVDAVLTEIVRAAEDSPTLAPLRDMPVHASADGTSPTTSEGHRFRLADDQIQALLMGEQLYGTPDLAIRELYQNALDACRYRQARTSYLTAMGTALPPWQGTISFRQGVDEQGRPFLECSDNGIGMGDRELVDVFAHAGVRFTDMPEYVEEQADWASVGIESFPNSRFGIGVLSYFMLADEITVTTCRLSRSGRPGQRLEVHIAGPDALFRVRDLGPGEDAGTVVRLRLRPTENPVRCTELLRRILWVSDFTVTSDDESGQQTWEPRRLSDTAPVGAEDAFRDGALRSAKKLAPASGGRVWWCDTEGAILADGIWAGITTFGAIVNLSGSDQPRLTVDRNEIIDFDNGRVDELMWSAVPTLINSPDTPLSHAWLSDLAETMPRLADEICERAIEARHRPWRVGSVEGPIEIVGCYPPDADALAQDDELEAVEWSAAVSRWRLAAWLRAGAGPMSPAVVPARPSDEILLEHSESTGFPGYVLEVAVRAHRSPAEVVARLAELGLPVPDPRSVPAEIIESDRVLLADQNEASGRYLPWDEPVPHAHVLLAAVMTGMTPSAVVARLIELGFDTSRIGRLPAEVDVSDQLLLKTRAAPAPLPVDEMVPVAHVMVVAADDHRTPAEIAARLAELGYATPDPGSLPARVEPDDARTFTLKQGEWTSYVQNPVPALHVVRVALATNNPPAHVAARLAAAGFQVSGTVPEQLTPLDRKIARRRHQSADTVRDLYTDTVVTTGQVVSMALDLDQPPMAIARRLAEFGFTTPSHDCLPDDVDSTDRQLLSASIGAEDHYYAQEPEWLHTGQFLSLPHILIAATKMTRSPLSIARRFAEFGFGTPPDHLLDIDVRLEDLLLLSLDLDGKPPWLTDEHLVVPLGHVLAAAARLARPPAEVAARLSELGLRPEDAPLPEKVERYDSKLLAWVRRSYRSGEARWIGLAAPADALHLLVTAGNTGMTPHEVARRLSALGVPVVRPRRPLSVDRTDMVLLSQNLDGDAPYRDLAADFPRADVMRAVSATKLLPGEVLGRLTRLGITVGE
ncbi:wHTH domain-containing protein [Lentzea aerocolonigenes]|uniref:wHTH domain-containing protein n=1 Tax=Lentzea aerocolonigenes TaxID=68170 RepID=UPI0004C2D980|nr:hypothetical protein [Lentzea aerocolonigenes]MCP2247524.1 hypothetical protein [Lentzea aerocolonigenes]